MSWYKQKLLDTVLQVLTIPSPTFKEKELSQFIKGKYFSRFLDKKYSILSAGDSFIATPVKRSSKPHLALVGHLDVVPEFVSPRRYSGRIYGAGASDMKASLGVFLHLLSEHHQIFNSAYQVSFIFYAKEEDTSLEDNGLYELIKKFPDWFRSLDLAILGEPTNNTVQIGCVGSIHAQVQIKGKACHSARPWLGENALYKALPFIRKVSQVKPRSYRIGGVVFKDVFQITVGKTDDGNTTIPGKWIGNVNYRFAPRFHRKEAITYFKQFLKNQGLTSNQFKIYSFSPMGKIVKTPLYQQVVSFLKKQGMTIEPKQAWTDVAQFGSLNIPSFNCGPGLSEKCHTPDEYVLEKYLVAYTEIMLKLLQ